ncbi:MAG: hypothetical protein R3A44_34210 [Caldilineaceae bacterium]
MTLFEETLFVDRERKLRGFEKLLQPATRQSVMLIEAAEKMGKTWLIIKMQRICQTPAVGVPAARIDFRNPLDMLKLPDHLGLIRLLRDRLEQPDYFAHLNTVINRVTANPSTASPSSSHLAALAEQIQKVFTLAELERFARFSDVEFENLEGATLFNKCFSLAGYFFRRQRLPDLIARLREERDAVDWQPFADRILAAPAMTDAESTAAMTDQNLRLIGVSEAERQHAERQVSEAFFQCLATLLADKRQVVLLFDAYEAAPEEAERFISAQLLPYLLDESLRDLVVIITGRQTPDLSTLGLNQLIVKTDLEPFGIDDVRDFMTVRSIQENPPDFTFKGVHLLSGGVPGDLALMADRLTAVASQHDPFFDD